MDSLTQANPHNVYDKALTETVSQSQSPRQERQAHLFVERRLSPGPDAPASPPAAGSYRTVQVIASGKERYVPFGKSLSVFLWFQSSGCLCLTSTTTSSHRFVPSLDPFHLCFSRSLLVAGWDGKLELEQASGIPELLCPHRWKGTWEPAYVLCGKRSGRKARPMPRSHSAVHQRLGLPGAPCNCGRHLHLMVARFSSLSLFSLFPRGRSCCQALHLEIRYFFFPCAGARLTVRASYP